MNWIKAALAAGVLLGLLLVAESVANYRNVIYHLLPDHMAKQAERDAVALEELVQTKASEADQMRALLQNPAQLHAILEEFQKERASEIASIRLIEGRMGDPRGQAPDATLVAQAGDPSRTGQLSAADIIRHFARDTRTLIENEKNFSPSSGTLIVAVPVRLGRIRLPETGQPLGTRPVENGASTNGARGTNGVRNADVGRPGPPPRPFDGNRPGTRTRMQAGFDPRRPSDANRMPGRPGPQPGGPGGPPPFRRTMRVAEFSLYLHDPFASLRRDMATSIAAAIALLAAVALLYFRLPAYVRGRELEQQIAVARQVQQELFPPAYSGDKSLDFAAQCVPIYEVGGDYYDIFITSAGETALAVGDVSGKGLPAALLMALIHGAIRNRPNLTAQDHVNAALELNSMLCARLPGDRFVSLFWAYYNSETRSLRYVNAGHPPPMLFDANGKAPSVRMLDCGGPVLGLLRDVSFESGSVTLNDGEVLVVYSDGLSEAWNAAGEEFGVDRLRQVIERNLHLSAGEIQTKVLDEVKKFAGPRPLEDDLTLLVVRFGAAEAAAVAAD